MKNIRNLWLENTVLPVFSELKQDLRVDVAIVGAGITGLTAAWLLKNAGKTVAVIDKSRIGHGESGRTTAHVTEILDEPYHVLIDRFGIEQAREIINSKRASIRKIASIVQELNIACHWEFLSGYRYAENSTQVEELQMESIALKMLGIPVELTVMAPLPFPIVSALRIHHQAQFNPAIYLSALAKKIPGNGSFIFENSLVSDFNEDSLCRLKTAAGTISAEDVILATNVPVSNRFFIQTKLAAYRSYAIAAPCDQLPNIAAGLFWDMQDPYHYIRTQKISYEGESRDFLIVGGEDHKTGKNKDTETCFDALKKFAHERFQIQDFPFQWSGQIIESADGLPFIGKNSFSKHYHIATGFSGNGITFGTLSAMILSDMILGQSNQFEKIYKPSRITLATAGDYLRENKDFPTHLVCDFLAHRTQTLNDIPNGEGKLVGEGIESTAVYCDSQGNFHGFSAVCPHLGCLVDWNSAEKTWDCPCHGSRFSCKGKVLNGPAHSELKPVSIEKLMHSKKIEGKHNG